MSASATQGGHNDPLDPFPFLGGSGAGKLTYCAFFDKSTNFGTEVDQYMMNKFGGGAIAELPPGGRDGHFPKWLPADI